MGKLTKIGKEDIILTKKFSKPEDMNVGEFSKAVAEDSGAMIKVTGIQDFYDLMINKSGKGKKWDKPEVTMGVSAGNLVITGKAKNGEQDTIVVNKGYSALKDKKDVVINAQKGDGTIDSSTKRMAKAKGVDPEDLKTAKLSDVKGDIIILAHGGSTGSSPGKVYCNNFGKKSVSDIVKYLTDTKPIPLDYSGTVYLDGCYTAAGPSGGTDIKDLNNFAGKVYSGLKGKGYKFLQVKGNLGTAKTRGDGSEGVVDAQAKKAYDLALKDTKKLKPLKDKYDELSKKVNEVGKKLTAMKKARMALNQTIKTAGGQELETAKIQLEKLEPMILAQAKLLKEAGDKATKAYNMLKDKKKEMEKKGITDKEFTDLVGTFGPESLPG